MCDDSNFCSLMNESVRTSDVFVGTAHSSQYCKQESLGLSSYYDASMSISIYIILYNVTVYITAYIAVVK